MALVALTLGAPFTCHWYPGLVPPVVVEEEKVTKLPEQKGFEGVLMVTLVAMDELTTMVISLEVTWLPFTQG